MPQLWRSKYSIEFQIFGKKSKKFRTDHKIPRLRGRRLNFQWLSTSIQIQMILLFCFPDNIIYSNSFFVPPNNHSIILNIYSKHSHSDRNKNRCKNYICEDIENICNIKKLLLTLTRPIGLPPHTLVARKIADQR